MIAALTEGDTHGQVGFFMNKPALPIELSAMVEKFHVGDVQYERQWPCVAIEHLKCGHCDWGTEYLTQFIFN